MRGALKILTVRGIPIRLHWSFLALFVILGSYQGIQGGLSSVIHTGILVCLGFSLVVLHELAHSIVAQRYGLTVREIVLLPIGGMAMMERIPEEPRKEAAIAVAGPLVNLAIAVILYYFMKWLPGITFDPSSIESNDTPFTWGTVALFQVNFMLFAFNIVPAFPMDGGRLLRAGLVKTGMTYVRATSAAVRTSQIILAIMLGIGVYTTNILLILIPIVLFTAASGEEAAVRARSSIKSLLVRHLIPQKFVSVSGRTTLGDMVPLLLSQSQRHFPVMRGRGILGVLSVADIRVALAKPGGPETSVASVMRPAVAVSPDDSLAEVQRMLESRGIPAAVITRGGRLLGMVSIDMLARLSSTLDSSGE